MATEVYIKFKKIPEDMKYEFDGPGHCFKVKKFVCKSGRWKGTIMYWGSLPSSGNSWDLNNWDEDYNLIPDAFDNVEEVDPKDITIIKGKRRCIK